MLFLVISTPAPTRPSEVRESRRKFWPWAEDKLASGIARSIYPRAGRGVVAIFDVDSHETLHRLLNEWSDIVPAEFGLYPLMEPESIVAFLSEEPES
jgi:muconolactone delta-isomerase